MAVSIRVNATATGANGQWTSILPGHLAVWWGGWVYPNTMQVWQDGAWHDTGYTSYPNPPQTFGQTSDYGTVNLTWAYPAAGGTPPHHYDVQKCDSNYTPLESGTTTGGSASYSVSQDTLYVFRVRSVTAAGLVSGWQDIRLGIGHPQATGSRVVRRSRPWRQDASDTGMQVGLSNGVVAGPRAPAYNVQLGHECGVVVEHTRYQVWSSQTWPTSWGFLRAMYWLGNDTADVGGVMSDLNINLPWGPTWTADHPKRFQWSNGGCWGVWLSGAGYDDKYGAYKPIYANIFLAGTEYYIDTESYVSVNAQANYAW